MDWFDHYEAANRAMGRVEDESRKEHPDWLSIVRWLGRVQEHFGEVAVYCVQQAYDQGATKKQLAAALNMSPSVLRGMVKTR